MEHLHLSYELVESRNASPAVGDSLQDSSDSIIESPTSVSVPSFILQYRINSAKPPSADDYESIEKHTRFFITFQLEKKLNRTGIGIAEESFASVPGEIYNGEDLIDIVFVPVFLFDPTLGNIPSEIYLDNFLITLFSGQSLVEYISSLTELDKGSVFAATNGVVFRRSQEPKLHPEEQQSVKAPYFAGACAGIITLLILFLWNQSMRVRSLMKRKAETIVWNKRNGCGDEEIDCIDPTDNGHRWGPYRDVSESDNDSSLDGSLIQEAFQSPLFSCKPDLENSATGSLPKYESGTANHILKQSSTQCNKRCNASSKCTDSGSCVKLYDDDCSSSADGSHSDRIEATHALQELPPCKKNVLKTLYGFEEPEPSKTSNKLSENGSSWCSSDESYEAQSYKSFEQQASLANGRSTLDLIFGTVRDYQKVKPRKEPVKGCNIIPSGDDNSAIPDKTLGVMKYNSFEQQPRPKCSQPPKESAFRAEDNYQRNKLRSNINDLDSGSDYSFSSRSEVFSSAMDSSVERVKAKKTSTQECNRSREFQDNAKLVEPELSKVQKTRLHAWLINQAQHDFVFCSRTDGFTKPPMRGRKQWISGVDHIDQVYQEKAQIGSGCVGSQLPYNDKHAKNQTQKARRVNRAKGQTRYVARNRKTKPDIHYRRKARNIRQRASSPDLEITNNDSFHWDMEGQETWTTKPTSLIWEGKAKEKNHASVMDQESNRTKSQLEEVAYTDRKNTATAPNLLQSVSFDRSAEVHHLGIEPFQPISEPRMNPQSLLQELKQHLTTRSTERKHKTRVSSKSSWKKKAHTNTFVQELKQELSNRKENKVSPLPRNRRKESGSRPNGFIDELKERLASRAMQLNKLTPIPVDKDHSAGRPLGDLIHELKVTLSNRKKRRFNYDFSAAKSKNSPHAFQNESLLTLELRKKLADRRRAVHDPEDSIAYSALSQSSTDAENLVVPSIAKHDQSSIEEGAMKLNSLCSDSTSTERAGTADHKDRDENMSTISELGEHSAAFTNLQSQFRNTCIGGCDDETKRLPMVVTARIAIKQDVHTNNGTGEREDPFKELNSLNQILESDSDTESTVTPVNEVIEPISDTEGGQEGSSKYPWKSVGDRAMTIRSRQNQMVVFDFVAPGKTPTDNGSVDVDLLSRYKDDILKERRKLQSIDRSINGDKSISSMPSYKARLFPTKKEKPDNIPWWLPDEMDSNTSSSAITKQHDMIHEIGDDTSMAASAISLGSSSYDGTNSTRSSFSSNVLKQKEHLQ